MRAGLFDLIGFSSWVWDLDARRICPRLCVPCVQARLTARRPKCRGWYLSFSRGFLNRFRTTSVRSWYPTAHTSMRNHAVCSRVAHRSQNCRPSLRLTYAEGIALLQAAGCEGLEPMCDLRCDATRARTCVRALACGALCVWHAPVI